MHAGFPFFVGCGRSGTTLFRSIFNAHPDLAVVNESHFIVPLARQRRRYGHGRQFAHDLFLRDLVRDATRLRGLGIPELQLRETLQAHQPHGFADAVRCVFALYASRLGKRRYGDKTPAYVNHVRLLGGLFQEAKFIHIIRDGRDVALAYLDRSSGPRDVYEAAWHWKSSVSRGRRAGRALAQGRYSEVRYEALLEDPERTVRGLCGFLELPFANEMFVYFQDAELRASAKLRQAQHRNLQRPITRGLRDWRRQMSAGDLAAFETIAGGLLEDLGYERAYPRVSLPAAAGTGWSWLKWQQRRASHQVALIRRGLRR